MLLIRAIPVATPRLASIASSLSVYPHHSASFNEAARGVENAHTHLVEEPLP
ncbi:hypothetical protein Mal4_00440 [Maioricimonas rarisocia]|uniref:Uncharacterized protein n=1 Tax=Maioricimonas rarisocia TaxID=2528026 RepID=A0A517YZX7_9PLAN|nr:hypothetical protein [Maioricimonas rarisocia]QDU35762.1 hypothetical protein Mal4_00440 [Maioricimonas rarisocia]